MSYPQKWSVIPSFIHSSPLPINTNPLPLYFKEGFYPHLPLKPLILLGFVNKKAAEAARYPQFIQFGLFNQKIFDCLEYFPGIFDAHRPGKRQNDNFLQQAPIDLILAIIRKLPESSRPNTSIFEIGNEFCLYFFRNQTGEVGDIFIRNRRYVEKLIP